MSSIQSIETPQDYVNYTFNLSARGVTEVTSELAGMSSTVSNLVGLMAFKTSEYLSNTEALLVSFGYAAAATFSTATQQAIRFEQALANVKAIGGETINEVAIGQAAMQFSNRLGMNVDAMTEGLEALSRAGLTATDVMSGVLEEGVKLSKLEGIDLEDSINNLISTTNLLAEGGYDVNSQEYAEAVKAMNQHIVSTSESAPINAQNIIQTLQHVGGYASANKIDQDDLFAVIAQLGSKGTKGEMAGTALRAFIAAGQKDQAQRALQRIGLDVSDLWDSTGDAMLPISEMKAVLDNALEARGYSQQEKLEFYADFAGYKQANQIMKINTDEVQQYKESIAQAWDLGTKLDEILGTVNSNLQIIHQTAKNFLTRVGQTALPILNAILQPIKWTVQLIDALPFSENIVGIGLTFLALKGLFVGINRVIPAIASLYTSFSRQEKHAKSIQGHFKNLIRDAKEFKDTIEHIKDPVWLANKRMENDKRGMGAVEHSKAVAQTMYGAIHGQEITGRDFNDLSKYEQSTFVELVASLGQDKEIYQTIINKIDTQNAQLRDAIVNLKPIQQEKVTLNIPDKNNKKSNLENNNDVNNARGGYQETSDRVDKGNQIIEEQKKVLKDTYSTIQGLKQHILAHTDKGTKQYDIGRGIMSIARPFSEVLVDAFFRKINLKEFKTKAGTIEFDKDIGEKATAELNNIFSSVKTSDLPDISFHYDNNIQQMSDKAQSLLKEIQNVAKIFSNVDINNMKPYQGKRALKTFDVQAMGSIGLEFSEMMNEAYIREILEQKSFNKDNKFIEKIYDEQVDLLAQSLSVDVSKIKDKAQKLEKIHDSFQSKDNNQTIDNVVASSAQWYHKMLNERNDPSEHASKWLNNDSAQYIMDTLGIKYDVTNTDMKGQFLTNIKSANAETKWVAQQLVFALQKSQSQGVYSGAEADELTTMVTHFKALIKSIDRLEASMPDSIEPLQNDNIKIPERFSTSHPAIKQSLENSASTYKWDVVPSIENAQDRVKDLLQNGDIRIDNNIPVGGFNRKGDVRLKDFSDNDVNKFFNKLIHELSHGALNHTLRGDEARKNLELKQQLINSGLYIPQAKTQEGADFGKPIAEIEADLVAQKVLGTLRMDTSFSDNRIAQLEKIIMSEYGSLDVINYDLINSTANAMLRSTSKMADLITKLSRDSTGLSDSYQTALLKQTLKSFNADTIEPDYDDFPGIDKEDSEMLANIREHTPIYIEFPDEMTSALSDSSISSIKEAIQSFDLSPITTILNDIKSIIEPSDESLTVTPNNNQQNVIHVHGDIVFNGSQQAPFDIQGNIIDTYGYSDDSHAIGSGSNRPMLVEQPDMEPPTDIQNQNDDIYEAAALSVMAMLQTFTDNAQFEIDSLRKFISTFLLFKKGVEIIEQTTDERKRRAQDVTDNFDALTQGINNQWLIFEGIVQSFLDMFKEQEEQEDKLNSLIPELTTNTRTFAQYLLGHSFVSVEDVSDELSEYVKETIKNVIDAVFNPPEKLVQIPESNGAIEDLKDTNKEDRKKGWRNPTSEKDSGEEVTIGSYRVPMDDNYPDVPPNLMPRGYPESLKEQLHTNAINRMAKNDTDMQAQRYAQAKAKSDGQQAIDDLMNMRHSMYAEIAKKHAVTPNSVTEDELDFIGLNQERDNKRKKKRDKEVTDEDLEKARTGVAWSEYEKSKAEKEKENQKRLSQGATDEDIRLGRKRPSLDDIYGTPSQHDKPIGPEPQNITGKEMAAKILGKTVEEIDQMEENRKLKQLIAFVDKNIINEEEPYVPSMLQEGMGTAISQGKRMHEFTEAYSELLLVASNIQQEINDAKEDELKAVKEHIQQTKDNIENTKEEIRIKELRRKFETGLYELTDEELELIGEGKHSKKPNSKIRADALQAERQQEQQEKNIEDAKAHASDISGLYDSEKPNIGDYQEKVKEDTEKRRQIEENKHIAQQEISKYSGGYDAENIIDLDYYQEKTQKEFYRKKEPWKLDSDDFWNEMDKLEEQGNNEHQEKIREQQERIWAQQQEMQIQGIEAQTELLNVAKNITEEEERKKEEHVAREDLKYLFGEESLEHKKQRYSQRLEELEGKDTLTPEERVEKFAIQGSNFVSDLLIKQANKLPDNTEPMKYSTRFEDTADKIDAMTAPLHRFNDALFRAGEIFPPLTIAAYGLEGALSVVTLVTDGLRFAQEAYAFVAGLLGLVIDEEAASTGVLTAAKYGNIVANWIEAGSEEQNAAAKLIGAGITWLRTGAEAALDAVRLIGLGPILLIIGAVIAVLAILYVSEQNHANALKESEKALEKSNASMKAAIANYKSMRSARMGEFDATRKHMAAVKESIALKKLETERNKRLMETDKNTKLKNDGVWGQYGLRAQLQKAGDWLNLFGGLGAITGLAVGEYEGTAEGHEGTSEQIRTIIDDESAFGLFNNSYQNYVDSYYKAHAYDFGRMDQFAPQLQELYGLETQLQKTYGTEGARDSEEFKRAVQNIADETGLSGDVIGQYLDQMQVEANVEYARTNAQAEFGSIQADATNKAMSLLFPETGNMSDQEALQYNMVMAAVNDEAYKAKRELFMNAMMEYAQAIVAVLTGDWGNIDKHVQAGNTYIGAIGDITDNQQRIAEESLDVAKENLRKDYGTKSYSYYGDTPFGGAVQAAGAIGLSVPSGGGSTSGSYTGSSGGSSGAISAQNPSQTVAQTTQSTKQALDNAGKQLQHDYSKSINNQQSDNTPTGVGDIMYGIVGKALDFAKHYDPIVGAVSALFGSDSDKPSTNEQVDMNKYEIHINTININTEDDPEKIKTAFMNLMIEMSEQITPRQVSRTIGQIGNANDNISEGVDQQNNNTNNNNPNPT